MRFKTSNYMRCIAFAAVTLGLSGCMAVPIEGVTIAARRSLSPNERVLITKTITSGMFDPGVVVRHSPPPRSWFAVGSLIPATRGREIEIADLLRHVGAVEIVDDIRATKWMKSHKRLARRWRGWRALLAR